MDTSLKQCEIRDVKGLYKLARKGEIKNFTGVNDTFEIPYNSDIVLNEKNSISQNINIIFDYIRNNNIKF